MKLLYLRQIADVSNVEYLYSHIRYFGTNQQWASSNAGTKNFHATSESSINHLKHPTDCFIQHRIFKVKHFTNTSISSSYAETQLLFSNIQIPPRCPLSGISLFQVQQSCSMCPKLQAQSFSLPSFLEMILSQSSPGAPMFVPHSRISMLLSRRPMPRR